MKPIAFKILCLAAAGSALALGSAPNSSRAADFRPVTNFFRLPEGWTLGACSAVSVNRQGEIFLFHRGKHPIIVLDSGGNYLRSWGDDVLQTPHGLRIDSQGNIWVTDIGSHRVFKFDPQGKVLLALGTGKPGTGLDQFDRPTDIAFGASGEFYVSDGYGNSRVLKFSPGGALITSWGQKGSGRGEFNLPHAVVVDPSGRVLVADRENNRIQIFDADGKWLDTWEGFAPFGLAFEGQGALYVADGYANAVLRLSSAGKVEQTWGKQGTSPGEFELPHMLGFDPAGNFYVGEINGKRFQKFVKQ
jgi:DNA-binding beta-propeller fold protein YncE